MNKNLFSYTYDMFLQDCLDFTTALYKSDDLSIYDKDPVYPFNLQNFELETLSEDDEKAMVRRINSISNFY